MKKRRHIPFIAAFLIVGLLSSLLFVNNPHNAYAEEYPLTFVQSTGAGNQSVYSQFSQITANINIPCSGGTPCSNEKKIAKVELMKDNSPIMEIAAPVGQYSWTGNQSLTGEVIPVISTQNKTTQGYYVWYRYSVTDPNKGWFADITRPDGSIEHVQKGNGPLPNPSDPDYPTLQDYPNYFDDQLTMSGVRTNIFTSIDTGTPIDSSVVQRSPTHLTAAVDRVNPIPSLPGIADDSSDPSTNVVNPVIATDIDSFQVNYSQNFDHLGRFKDLAAPGARVMVYYAAFDVEIESNTYRYPDKVRVTWELVDKPDLVATDIQASTSLVINSNATFQVTFDNGSIPVSIPFTVTLYQGVEEWGRWTYPGATANQHFSESVAHMLAFSGAMNLTLTVDTTGAINEADEGNNTKTRSFTVGTGVITGDFDITPGTINYRDSFQLVPKNITGTSGCTYISHKFRLSKGTTWDTPTQTSPTTPYSFNYPSNYPTAISAGVVTVQMNITGSCGESGWITKFLTVNTIVDNHAPYFKMGWFSPYDNSGKVPYTQVVVGTALQLRVIDDPPSPSDLDGDPFWINGWDFNSSSDWVKSLPGFYGFSQLEEKLTNITANTLGFHTIWATMTDPFGATYKAGATIEVIPPNPIPVAACPPTVKENRPVAASLFNANGSYSPLGRQIDHARDEWTNKLTSYTNGTTSDITVQASLHVWDNGSPALKSLQPAICNITVKPDLPPIGKLDVPPLTIRSMPNDLYNKSYSSDNDAIVSVAYRYKYDAENDGFANDGWIPLTGNMSKATFTAPKVGKYMFDVTVCEDYGKCASATATQLVTSLILDTINLNPEVSFTVSGKNPQPDLNAPISYPASSIFNGWNLFKTNTATLVSDKGKNWSLSGSNLSAGMGRNFENSKPNSGLTTFLPDYGYGNNGLSPYRSGVGTTIKTLPILVPSSGGWDIAQIADAYNNAKFRTNQKYMYFASTYSGGKSIFAFNKSKIGNYVTTQPVTFSWKHNLDLNPYDFIINYSSIGNQCYCTSNGSLIYASPSIAGFELSDRTLYVAVQWTWGEPSGSYDEWGSEIYYEVKAMGLVTFDSFTGQKLGLSNKALPGAPNYNQMFKRGDNIRYIGYGYSSNGFSGSGLDGGNNTVYEFNRLGQLVSSKSLNQLVAPPNSGGTYPYYYKANFSEFFKDGEGNQYRYEYITSTWAGNTNYFNWLDVYFVKYNAVDMSLAWRTKLGGNMPGWWYNNGVNSQVVADNVNRKMHVFSSNITSSPYVNYSQALDFDTGASVGGNDYRWAGVTWNGGSQPISSTDIFGVTGIEGYYSTFYQNSASPYNNIRRPDGSYVGSFRMESRGPGDGWTQGLLWAAPQYQGALIGDGMYLSSSGQYLNGAGRTGGDVFFLNILTPSTDTPLINPTELGQFVSPFTLDNSEINLTLNMMDASMDKGLAGLSFRMQDPLNRYAVETDGSNLYLSRYINGSRAVLLSIAYTFQSNLDYTLKVKVVGTQIDVSLNGVPYLSVADGSFASGKIGPFADKSFVDFKALSSKVVQASSVDWLTNYAIWESGTATAEVRYDTISFTDPEGDPRAGSNQWSITHTPKFMNNQGVSAMNGQTYTSERLTFDKVGEYWVTLQARDDPNPSYLYPSMVFDSYRKNSNAFQQRLIVHRRPVAQFNIWVNGDGTIGWNDTSYDPDRWVSAGSYSAPDTTGIDYGATRGIMERKYYYIAPSGAYVESKLTRPMETGTYTVGLSVRDEYGAWSNPYLQSITVGSTPPPNTRPTATLTYPNGTQSSPNLIYTTRPTITWNQNDTGGTIFQGFHVKISNESGQVIAESGERPQWTSATSATWNVPVDLPVGVKLQVQVRVSDGEEWSIWSNVGWMKVNIAPTVALTYPNGLQVSPNLIQDNRRPTISWNQYDVDLSLGTYFQGYHVQVLNDVGTLIYDYSAGQYTQSNSQSMAVTADLPTAQPLQVRVRVHDGVAWSEWSNIGWLLINMTPSANITTPSGTQAAPSGGGPQPTIFWTQTDPDPGTVFLKYQVQFWNEANTSLVRDSGEVSQNTSSTTQSYQVTADLPAGQKLRVRVRVFDGYVWSNWSTDRWLLTNRPPVADFTWSPTLIWEGDTVSLINTSTDPDGSTLSSGWSISGPGSYSSNQTTTNATITGANTANRAGTWNVQLTVTDPQGASNSVTKQIVIGVLTIDGQVQHTAEWEQYRQSWNTRFPASPRAYSVFWAGEALELSAALTNTQTSTTKPTTVTAELVATSDLETLTSNNSINYTGTMLRLNHPRTLTNGSYIMRFKVVWSNGVVKIDDVPFDIAGDIFDVIVNQVRE